MISKNVKFMTKVTSFPRLNQSLYLLKAPKYTTKVNSTQPITHLPTLKDLSDGQINQLIKTAIKFKKECKEGNKSFDEILRGKSVALIFNKRSTRTRVATETSSGLLGAKSLYLASSDIQLGVNESLKDTTKVLSSMVDCIVARVNSHSEIEELMKHSKVPVVNALCDKYHPTQILADLMTLHETYCDNQNIQDPHEHDLHLTLKGKKMAWIGDVNNVLYSLMLTLPKFGMHLNIASPKGYNSIEEISEHAKGLAAKNGTELNFTSQPEEALNGSDVIVTDTWVSMGQETEFEKRLKDFEGYQITNSLIKSSKPSSDWKFLHCLPRKPYEVDDEVFYSDRSLVFQEAENRKWTIMAVLYSLMHLKHFPSK